MKTHWRNRTVTPPALCEEADAHRSSSVLTYNLPYENTLPTSHGVATAILFRIQAGVACLHIDPVT